MESIIFSATDNGTDNFSCFHGLVFWCDLLKIVLKRQNTNRLASSPKWEQVEVALGGQTDSQVSSQVRACHKNNNISRQTILYFIG